MASSYRQRLLSETKVYRGALLVLDFVGEYTNGKPYFYYNGRIYDKVTDIPGWTYTGGTPAGRGSYAPKADGSLQFFPSYTNLLTYSEQFDNAAWTKFAAPITADAIAAPTGTTTADKMTPTAASSLHYMVQSITNSTGQFTSSVYAKSAGYTKFRLNMTDNATGSVYGSVDLTAGTVAMTSDGTWTGGSASIQALSNGWYRVTVTGTRVSGTSTALRIDAQDASGNLSFTGDGTSGIYVWGAQLELGSTASTYIPTTTAAVTVAPPRITDAGYLAEEARTNLLTYSQQFDNADWTKAGATITADTATAPDGTTTADKLNEDATTGLHRTYELKTKAASAITYTYSVYAKAAERTQVRLTIDDAAGNDVGATFNISSGSIVTAAAATGTFTAPSATITQAANGYYFITVTGTSNTATSVRVQAQVAVGGVVSYAGTAGSGIYIWQADLQAGSFATSPIPTTSVAVTRAADVGYISGLTVPSAYSVLFDAPVPLAGPDFIHTWSLNDGTNNNASTVYIYRVDMSSQSVVTVGGVAQAVLGLGTVTAGAAQKVAFRLAANDFGASRNGGSAVTDTSGTLPPATTFYLGRSATGAHWGGPIRRIVIYPRAMSNAELQAITTAGAASVT